MNVFVSHIESIVARISVYTREIVIALGVILGLAGAFVLFRYYRYSVEVAAHKDFVEAMRHFNASVGPRAQAFGQDVLNFVTEEDKWSKVVPILREASQRNSGSALLGVFLAYYAQALYLQGNATEALTILQSAIPKIPDTQVQSLYELKLALMEIDQEDAALKEQGLNALRKLTANDKMAAHEPALYYAGEYFWHAKNFGEAKNYWSQLVLKYAAKNVQREGATDSTWVERAKTRLKLIEAK